MSDEHVGVLTHRSGLTGPDEASDALVRFVIHTDGAEMSCRYCGDARLLGPGDAAVQVLLFQEAHFACDPALRGVS